MAKNAFSDWSITASDNTDVGGISLAENVMLPSAVNNALREMMAQLKGAGFLGSTYFVAASAAGPAKFYFAEDTDNGTNKVTLQAPSSLGSDVTVTLPSTTGTLYASGGTDVALADGGTGASLTDPNADRIMFWDDSAGGVAWLTPGTGLTITGTTLDAFSGLTLGTPQSPSGVASVDFTGIPATAKQMIVSVRGVSAASGSVDFAVQIGDSGGVETSGYTGLSYNSGGGSAALSSSFPFGHTSSTSSDTVSGSVTLTLFEASSNTWACSGQGIQSGGLYSMQVNGTKALSAALDRVRVLISASTFDAGTINIAYL